jgi:PAS domain S-box-containing protein
MRSENLSILFVEDNPDDFDLALRELRGSGVAFEARSIETEAEFRASLQDLPDVVVADYKLPQFSGLAALNICREHEVGVPFIMLTGSQSEEIAVECLKAGADDYLPKSSLRRLPGVLKAVLEKRQKQGVRFSALAETVDGIVVIHQKGRCRFANAAAERILGYTQKEILRKNFWDFIHPDFQQLVQERGLKRERGERVPARYEFPVVRPDGEVRWLNCSANQVEFEGRPAVLVSAVDITTRKKADEALRESEALKASIMESALDCIIVMDHEGRILELNPAAEKTFGYLRSEIIGEPLVQKIIPPALREQRSQEIKRALGAGQGRASQRMELTASRSDGTEFPAELAIVPLKLSHRLLFTVYLRDITERKKAEQRSAVFLELACALNAAASAQEAAKIIVQAARTLLGWDACYLHLYSAEQLIQPILTMDTVNGAVVEIPSNTFTLDPSPLMLRVMTKGALLIDRGQSEHSAAPPVPLVAFGDKQRRSASLLYVPIRHEENAIGILSIQSYMPGAYRQKDLATLQSLSDYCGGALSRIRTVAALEASEQKNRSLLRALPDWVLRFRKDGAVLDSKAPKKFRHLFKAHSAGDQLDSFLSQPLLGKFLRSSARALASGESQTFECEIESAPGDGRHYEVRLVVSNPEELLAVIRDVTEQKYLARKVLEISASERRRIGHDLHDGLVQYLGSIAFKAKLIELELAGQSRPEAERAGEVGQLLRNAMRQVRLIARGLDPVEVEPSGLPSALARLAQDTESLFEVACQFQARSPNVALDSVTNLHLYRVVQEAIHNGIRHGDAHRLKVELEQQGNVLHISIKDDGRGFCAKNVHSEGLGLRIMKLRAEACGGQFEIHSSEGEGTTVNCSVPLKSAASRQRQNALPS